MNLNKVIDTKYKIEVVSSIFTVDKGVFKVLLIKSDNKEDDKWSLVNGDVRNDETFDEAMLRIIKEKTNIPLVQLISSNNYSSVDRKPLSRVVAISYIGIVDIKTANLIVKSSCYDNVLWFSINDIPELAYDYNEILTDAINLLKKRVLSSDILRSLYPDGFTLPEMQKVYEAILNKELDRRNFRKRMLNLGLINDTGEMARFEGNKLAKLYKFNDKIDDKNVF